MKGTMNAAVLNAPRDGIMVGKIAESINSKIKIKINDKKENKRILDDIGFNTALEIKNSDELKP